jgi:hypothetical protein
MKKVFLLLFFVLQFQGCIKPGMQSVVDNTLFSHPYKDPQFYIMFSGKKEQRVASKFADELRETFETSSMYPFINLIDLNEMTEAQIKTMQEKAISDNTADVIFNLKITHMSLYENYGMVSITDFNYLATAFDFKINKEVWKSNVYSPWYGDSVNKTAVMFVQKLKSDKVL